MQSCHAKIRLVQDQARSLRNCNHCPPLARGGMLDAFCNGFWILLKPWYFASSCEGQEFIPLKFGSHDGRFLKRKSNFFKIYIYMYIQLGKNEEKTCLLSSNIACRLQPCPSWHSFHTNILTLLHEKSMTSTPDTNHRELNKRMGAPAWKTFWGPRICPKYIYIIYVYIITIYIHIYIHIYI